ncbi:MAG: hypothetical protein KDD89_05005, partial [Anaerolineales bacterium]|nr:hypothetical protein [Anaerolineales bacterium]
MLFKLIGTTTFLMAIAAGGLWGWLGFTAVVLLVGLASSAYIIETRGKITVPELTIGVIYHKKGEKFDRFLEPGTHWMNPHKESLGAYISTAGQSAKGHTKSIQAIGGLSLDAEWTLAYTLRPQKIAVAKRPKLARALPTKASAIARQQIGNILH